MRLPHSTSTHRRTRRQVTVSALIGAGVVLACAMLAIGTLGIALTVPIRAQDSVAQQDRQKDAAEQSAAVAIGNSLMRVGPGAEWEPVNQPVTGARWDWPSQCSLPAAQVSPQVGLATKFRNTAGAEALVGYYAYTAGLGGLAVSDLIATADNCSLTTPLPPDPSLGPQTHRYLLQRAIDTQGSEVILWQYGDVLLVIEAPPGVATPTADRYIALAEAQLPGLCLNKESPASDAHRSPWGPVKFMGRTVTEQVAIPAATIAPPGDVILTIDQVPATGAPLPALTPTPDPLPTPTRTATPTPSATPKPPRVLTPEQWAPILNPSGLPSVVLPERPEDPVFPDQLPAPVPRPTAPTLSPEPTATTISVRVDDPGGPGCGWDFTQQAAPQVDEEQLFQDRTEALLQARTALQVANQGWQRAARDYWTTWAQYTRDAHAYLKYEARVADIALAWEAIQQARDEYDTALSEYEKALAAYERFIRWQDRARERYDADVRACDRQPAPAPTPSASPSPSASPAPTPSASPAPTPSPTRTRQCPPPVPFILSEPTPTVPPSPTPPPPPGPSSSPTPRN